MSAAYSLQCRHRSIVSWLSPNHRPGAEIDVMAVWMPLRSIASIDICGVHSGVLPARISGPILSSPTIST